MWLAVATASLCVVALFGLLVAQDVTPDSHPSAPLPTGPSTRRPAPSGAPSDGVRSESAPSSATTSTPKALGPTSSAEELAIDASTSPCPGGCLTEAGRPIVEAQLKYGQLVGVVDPHGWVPFELWPDDVITGCQCVYPLYLRKARRDPTFDPDQRMARPGFMPMPVYRTICSTLYGDVESLPPCWRDEEAW